MAALVRQLRGRRFVYAASVLVAFGAHDYYIERVRTAPPKKKRFTPGSAGMGQRTGEVGVRRQGLTWHVGDARALCRMRRRQHRGNAQHWGLGFV